MNAPTSGYVPRVEPVRIALDVLGGDGAPADLLDAVPLVLQRAPGIQLVLVGPADEIRSRLAARGMDVDTEPRLSIAASTHAVGMAEDPIGGVRNLPTVSARVAAECVRDGRADALVSLGHTGAAVAAATLFLGRLGRLTRPVVAVAVPALAGPVILLDAGAGTNEPTSEDLLAYAVMGVAYAEALHEAGHLTDSDPIRVGLLTIGTEPGKGDPLRVAAAARLELDAPSLAFEYVGGVEGHDVALGGAADVVVTDGFTGNVLLKGLEGAAAWGAVVYGDAYGDPEPARDVLRRTRQGPLAAGLLLGVNGVVVVGHGASSAESVTSCVQLAQHAVEGDVVGRVRARTASIRSGTQTSPTPRSPRSSARISNAEASTGTPPPTVEAVP